MTYSVMAVCTGNICRSPMAEIVLRSHLTAAGLDREVTVSSTAVTSEELGNPIDPRARRVLTEAGYVVEQHQARRVQVADVIGTDLALAMSAQHVRALRGFGFDQERVALFRAFEHGVPDEPIWQVSAPDTPDPWYGDHRDFQDTLQIIETCAPHIVQFLRTQLGEYATR